MRPVLRRFLAVLAVLAPARWLPRFLAPARWLSWFLAPARWLSWLLAPARWWRDGSITLVMTVAYWWIGAAASDELPAAIRHAQVLLDVEHRVGLDIERPLNQALVGHHWLATVAGTYYLSLNELGTALVIVWAALRCGEVYRYARLPFIVSTGLSFIVCAVLPTAPPRLLPDGGFTEVSLPLVGTYDQAMSYTGGNELAAFPSVHLIWALWCGAVIYLGARRWWARGLGLSYPVLTAVDVVVTANHFVLDVLAGVLFLAIGVVALWLAVRLTEHRSLFAAAPVGTPPASGDQRSRRSPRPVDSSSGDGAA